VEKAAGLGKRWFQPAGSGLASSAPFREASKPSAGPCLAGELKLFAAILEAASFKAAREQLPDPKWPGKKQELGPSEPGPGPQEVRLNSTNFDSDPGPVTGSAASGTSAGFM